MCDDVDDFYDTHCKFPGGVVVVFTPCGGAAVFSSLSKAEVFSHDVGGGCVISPHMIDHPDHGCVTH